MLWIFASYTFVRRILYRIYRELKTNNSITNQESKRSNEMGKGSTEKIQKEEIKMADKNCPTFLEAIEFQSKST